MAEEEEWRATLVKDCARVAKKQRVASQSSREGVQALLREVAAVRAAAVAGGPVCVEALRARLSEVGDAAVSSTAATAKELTAVVGKLGKTVDKHLSLDSARAWWERPSDPEALKQVCVEHLMREGRSHLATLYCREAGVTAVAAEPYEALHAVVAALRTHDVAPALSWLTQHRCALAALTSPHQQSGVAALEFALHRQHFLMLLQREGRGAAVAYARSHFQRLDASLLGDWQRLMGALLYAGRLLESPYSELLSESAWERAVHLFTRECCALLGTASESPLAVVVDAGTAALPTLVKMTSVVAAKGQSWQALQQLPLEVALPPRLAFHSVFACPVAREQSSPDNPPMILPCGLVLCKQSIQKLARGSGRLFKCPYCPLEVPVSACKPVFF